jgi:tetratricopeptide (TPR) repeat protein
VRVDVGYTTRVPMTDTVASVFPILPRDQTVTLDMNAANQARTMALLTLLPLHLERADTARAQELFATAEGLTPYSNEMKAAMDFYRGYLLQTTAPRDLDEAIRAYNRNLQTTSLYEAHLNRGLAYLVQNEDAAAKADFQRAQGIHDARPEAWRAGCWAFALEQQPQAALPLCDAAATRDPTGWTFDTRGIVYAELGRYADAANEFSNFLRWLDTQPTRTRELFAPTRALWIETLRAGKNPFDAETLNGLRGSP